MTPGMNVRTDVLDKSKPKVTGRDVAYRALAAALGGPVDLVSLAMMPFGYREEKPVGGSEWIGRQMERAGLVSTARDPLVEFAASLAVPGPGAGTTLAKGSLMAPALMGVVKQKGGNWLTGSVEEAVKGLKKPTPDDLGPEFMAVPEVAERAGSKAVNEFVDKQLTRYIKNQMATPEDPVRALAEKGVLHFDPRQEITGGSLDILRGNAAATRQRVGTPIEGLGQSQTASDWEAMSDAAVGVSPAGTRLKFESFREKNPWLEKLDPEAPTYHFVNPTGELGFDHLVDELYNAVREGSDLPANLRLKPESVQRMGVPQAVEHVSKINKWRADQMAEANAKLARNPATVPFREYPTVPGTDLPNEKGLKWVELKQPEAGSLDKLPEGWKLEAVNRGGDVDPILYGITREGRVHPDSASQHANTPEIAFENFKRGYGQPELEDALKYEGSTMGHCVGGYCDDVISGKSRIYSLRDAKGEPHVTIEVGLPDVYSRPQIMAEMRDNYGRTPTSEAEYLQWARELGMADTPSETPKIKQIKGKQNRKPNDEYLPFVQDFVRSQKWSDVGDIGNAGMMPLNSLYNTHPTKLGLPVELYDPAKINPYDLAELLPEWFSKEDLIQAAKTLLQR